MNHIVFAMIGLFCAVPLHGSSHEEKQQIDAIHREVPKKMKLYHARAEYIGNREEMQDYSTAVRFKDDENGERCLFGIYDGHGGTQVAKIAQEKVHKFFGKSVGSAPKKLERAFVQTDEHVFNTVKNDLCGSCAIAAYIGGNTIHCAWAGDSRAIVVRNGKVVCETVDHTLRNERERKRVESFGGTIYDDEGTLRVNGLLVPTRVLGDKTVKGKALGAVISYPEVISFALQHEDKIILASDGVWDSLNNETVANIVSTSDDIRKGCEGIYQRRFDAARSSVTVLRCRNKERGEPLQKIAQNLVAAAYCIATNNDSDNITAQVIQVRYE